MTMVRLGNFPVTFEMQKKTSVMKNIKTLLLLVILALLLSGTLPTRAQETLHLAFVEIDLWPEYDRPEMLVIYHVKLPAGASLPAEVVLLIPANAGEPNAVAVRQMDGNLLNATYERQIDGEWAQITVMATMPEIQLEYYDPALVREGDSRAFTYVWKGEHPVDEMKIVIQEPLGASHLSIEPDLGRFMQSQDPMRYYAMEVGAPQKGETVTVNVSYRKENDALSIDRLQVQPSGQSNEKLETKTSFMVWLPWVIGGVGSLLLLGGGIWFWRLNQEDNTQPQPRKRGKRAKSTAIKSPEQIAVEGEDTGVYCHQCGKRAASSDRFCRACGAKLRRP